MGHEAILFGCIYGGIRNLSPLDDLTFEHNQLTINALPIQLNLRQGIYLSRDTFHVPMPKGGNYSGFYRTQMIHFAQSFKFLSDHFEEWITHFESLLRNLYWREAYLFVE